MDVADRTDPEARSRGPPRHTVRSGRTAEPEVLAIAVVLAVSPFEGDLREAPRHQVARFVPLRIADRGRFEQEERHHAVDSVTEHTIKGQRQRNVSG